MMRCPRCGRESPEGQKFCGGCGQALDANAPAVPDSWHQEVPPAPGPPARYSGLAIAALVLGVLVVTAPIGMILGIIAIVQINNSNGRLKGMELAIVGLVIGALAILVVGPILAAIVFPVFSRAREKARQSACLSNLKQLGAATQMYVTDFDQQFPPDQSWSDGLWPYVNNEEVFRCPVSDEWGYALNRALVCRRLPTVTSVERTPALFDADDGEWNATMTADGCAYRHDDGTNVLFVDGHAEWQHSEKVDDLLWSGQE